MGNNRPLTSDERLEIVALLKKGNLSHRQIAKQFGRSQSTVSTIARDAGITPTHRRRRSPAAKAPEGTYSREERINVVDRIIGVLSGMVDGGGLTPKEVRDVTQTAKVALDARRAEDFEPDITNEPDEDGLVSIGLGEMRVDPNTYIGRELLAVQEQLEQESGHAVNEYGAGDRSTSGGF